MQSIKYIIFDKPLWTEKRARQWLKDINQKPIEKVEIYKKNFTFTISYPEVDRYGHIDCSNIRAVNDVRDATTNKRIKGVHFIVKF